ncbi:MAG: methyl-accepting chemotaxis protein [Methyloprofundus sp.]|nr:methyl-accepting chemotaxis protein [Methyloprofundus sp.]
MIGNSISKKVMAGYVVILLTVLLAGLFLHQQSSYIGKTNEAFTAELLPKLQAIESISKELSELQLSAYALYGTTINAEQFSQLYTKSKSALDERLHQFGSDMSAKGDTSQTFNNLYRIIDELYAAMNSDSVDWDEARRHLESLQSIKNKLDKELDDVKKGVQEEAQKDSNYIQQQILSMHNSILLVGLVILMIIITAFYISRRGIVLPAKSLSRDLGLIISSMDLTKKIEISSKDELLSIAEALNSLIVTFRTNAQTGKQSAQELIVSAGALEQLSSTVRSEIAQFSNYIKDLNEQVSVVEHSILNASEKSKSASEVALTGAEQAESGAKIVNNAARGIDELSQDLQISSDMLTALKASGDQVGAVVKTIAEIAEQTNLLALNAAIEAARAGESGRGFAVVADEVRLLATRTHESTHQINDILATIVQSITDAVASMDSNQIKAKGTVDAVHQTVDSLELLRGTILNLSKDNQSLAHLTQSNETVIAEMRNNLAEVLGSNQTIAQGGEKVHDASNQLMRLSTALQAVSNKFKT